MITGNVKSLGERIRLLRLKNQWTQEEVAKRLYISIPAYSKIETGVTDLNLSRLEQIGKVFNLTVVELFDFHGRESKDDAWDELRELSLLLRQRNQEVIDLQKKIICLYEELRRIKVRE